jgi:ligand-binding sensor domain-containing protein/signal transduction histidine kinase
MLNRRWAIACATAFYCVFAAVSGVAQDTSDSARRYIVDVWNTDTGRNTGGGLPHSTVTSIIQSHDGYLWLGTRYGLARFDGLRCELFHEGNTPGLGGAGVAKLFEDRHGSLWIGTETGGLLRIKDGQVKPLGIGENSPSNGAFSQRLVSACEDAAGAVWLYTADGQLWRHTETNITRFEFGLGRASACRSVVAEADGDVWVGAYWGQAAVPAGGTATNLVEHPEMQATLDYLLGSRLGGYWRCLVDGRIQKCRGNVVEREFGPYPWGRAMGAVSAACEDLAGNLIIGTRGNGVFWLDAGGNLSPITTAQGLPPGAVLALCMDREGNLWVGSDGGGLSRVKQNQFETIDETQGLSKNAVQSVCADAHGGLWIGLNEGGGAYYWKNGRVTASGRELGLVPTYVRPVWSIIADHEQNVWAGTYGSGLYAFKDGWFRPVAGPKQIHAIFEDRQNRIWLGTQEGLARLENNECRLVKSTDGVSIDEIRALADDSEGGIWIGSAGSGLSRYLNGAFQSWHAGDGLPSDSILSLYCDADNVLWIGTKASGLVRFHKNQWTRYTITNGLASDRITYQIEDKEGHLWLGSPSGIMRVAKKELNQYAAGATRFISCRSYDQADGLPTKECTMESQPGACLDASGKLWFATAKGLVGVNPKTLQSNPWKPPVIIEDVLVDGQPQNARPLRGEMPARLEVPPGKRRLEIKYTALNLSAADKSRFKYMLEGHDLDWKEAGNDRVASYTKLPPNTYTFRVKACNEDGVWNEEGRNLEILVQPPIWRTWWFLTLVSAGLLGGGAGIVHYFSTQKLQRQLERMRHQEALEKERQRIAQDIHDQLGASLTSVTMLSELVEGEKDNPEEVEAYARQIAQNTRDTTRILDEIVWAVNPVNDTLDSLMSYACKNMQEFLSLAGLQYRLDMPEQLPKLTLPPEFRHNIFLALKESITNVVRHSGATSVQVRVRLESGNLILEIEDNGKGLAEMDEKKLLTRNGVRGMRKRMASIGGQFSLVPGREKGTLVRLVAPLEHR